MAIKKRFHFIDVLTILFVVAVFFSPSGSYIYQFSVAFIWMAFALLFDSAKFFFIL